MTSIYILSVTQNLREILISIQISLEFDIEFVEPNPKSLNPKKTMQSLKIPIFDRFTILPPILSTLKIQGEGKRGKVFL